MKKFNQFLVKIDQSFPDPWIVDGVVQARPVKQIVFILGVIIGTVICFFIQKYC